jgi:hypothetical protein
MRTPGPTSKKSSLKGILYLKAKSCLNFSGLKINLSCSRYTSRLSSRMAITI